MRESDCGYGRYCIREGRKKLRQEEMGNERMREVGGSGVNNKERER